MSRYQSILDLIEVFKPQSIVETGVWNGQNAVRMINAAQKYNQNIFYCGYDLFENASQDTDEKEFNVKKHFSYGDVMDYLRNETNAQVSLIRGDTNETLKPIVADFAFIDGGHSLETIRHDYEQLKRCSVIVFDDYYTPDEDGLMPDISKIGCNRIVENLPHAIIESEDWVSGGGRVNLAVVFGT